MREIKFRAWDGQQMEYNIPVVNGKQWSLLRDCAIEGYPIMQFTGYQDSNLKDIYDGDMIEANDIYGKYKGSIEWWNDRWVLCYLGHVDKSKQYQSLMTVKGSLVIGNIYKTPELLTP